MFSSNNASATTATTATTAYSADIIRKDPGIVHVVEGERAQELATVLRYIDTKFGSHDLVQHATVVNNPAMPDFHGRVQLRLPKEVFFGTTPGAFELRASWPEIRKGMPHVKVTLNYRVDANTGKNVILSSGGGDGTSNGWTNIGSGALPVESMLAGGYVDRAAIPEFLAFVQDMGQASVHQRLTPQSDVYITLREVIVPRKQGTSGRAIVTDKAPGESSGIGMAFVHFSGATLLPAINGLVGPDGKAVAGPTKTLAQLAAEYGLESRPVAQIPTPAAPLQPAANPLSNFAIG